MKSLGVFFTSLAALSLSAKELTLEDISPHLPAAAPIVWQAATNQLPSGFWFYRRFPPRPFSATIISNAVVMAGLEDRGIPKPATNSYYVVKDMPPGWACMVPVIFVIDPQDAHICYSPTDPSTNTEDIPNDAYLTYRAWRAVEQLGMDYRQLTLTRMTSRYRENGGCEALAARRYSRGVRMDRVLDGISFVDYDFNDEIVEGFTIEYGSHGRVQAFAMIWPELARTRRELTASPGQIIACIRAGKAMSLPVLDEAANYFARLKSYVYAQKLTINKITPYYGEGIYGQWPTNGEPAAVIAPLAKLEAVADFGGGSNAPLHLLVPITSPGVEQLLGEKALEPNHSSRDTRTNTQNVTASVPSELTRIRAR